MKVKIKRLLLLILLITVLGMPLMLSACTKKPNLETDYFICWQGRDGTKERNEYIIIRGLTELGKQQKNLVIPKTINGINVSSIRDNTYPMGTQIADFESDVLEKIYFTKHMVLKVSFEKCPKFEKSIFTESHINGTSGKQYYKKSSLFNNKIEKQTPANTSYLLNYMPNEKEDYYWVDDIENGEKIEYIPENPVREGYAFGGWYKEPQCINKWDFEIDKVQKIEFEEGMKEEDFLETRLYAKWTKN